MSRFFAWALLAVLTIMTAGSALAGCTWSVVSTTWVTTYGTFTEPSTGSTTQVPLYTTVTVYWQADCVWDDPIYLPPPNEPEDGETATTRQSVTITQVNTTDPERPLITANVFSDDFRNPPTEVSLLINGYLQSTTAISQTGDHTLQFNAIRTFGDGATSIGIETCNARDECAEGQTILSKHTPAPVEGTTQLTAHYMEGDEWRSVSYGHNFWQAYSTTSFSVAEVGENARRHLKENATILTWPSGMVEPVPTIRAHSRGTVSDGPIALDWCGGTQLSPAESATRCGWFGSYGLSPWVEEWLSSLRTIDLRSTNITSGGSLSVAIP